MKKVGLFLIVCVFLSLFSIQPATAQQAEFGFIPLLSEKSDATLPREVSSTIEYDRLKPFLIEAKSLGLISSYEADLNLGLIKVVNPSPELRNKAGNLPIVRSFDEAFVRPQLIRDRSGSLASTITITMAVYSQTLSLETGIPGAHIKGTLKSPSGEVLGVTNGYADIDGNYWSYWSGYNARDIPGYKVNIKVYDPAEVLIGTFITTIPRINFTSINKSTGVISGIGQPGKGFSIEFWHANLDSYDSYYFERVTGTISSTGSWSADFGRSFRGGDNFYFDMSQSPNFVFRREIETPRINCHLKTNSCWLDNLPNKKVKLTITHTGTPYIFEGVTDYNGEFLVSLNDSNGDPVLINSGDSVSGTDAVAEKIPNLALNIDRLANSSSGTAPASKWFNAGIYIWETGDHEQVWVKTNSAGTFTANFSMDIPSIGLIAPDISFRNPSTGNSWYYMKLIP